MPRYSEEFKEQVVRKMMAPNAQSVAQGFEGDPRAITLFASTMAEDIQRSG